MKRRSVQTVVLGLFLLAGCGGPDGETDVSSRRTTTTTTGSSTTTSTSASETTATTTSGKSTTTTTGRATTTARPATGTGIRGIVKAGPTCPVQREGDPSCDDKPIPADLTVMRGSTVVGRAHAGEDGRFSVAVAPGRYTVTAKSERAMHCADTDATAPASGYTDIVVQCDTGIR